MPKWLIFIILRKYRLVNYSLQNGYGQIRLSKGFMRLMVKTPAFGQGLFYL
jgi:hypothetical protein